jgi:hypothetical protein
MVILNSYVSLPEGTRSDLIMVQYNIRWYASQLVLAGTDLAILAMIANLFHITVEGPIDLLFESSHVPCARRSVHATVVQ